MGSAARSHARCLPPGPLPTPSHTHPTHPHNSPSAAAVAGDALVARRAGAGAPTSARRRIASPRRRAGRGGRVPRPRGRAGGVGHGEKSGEAEAVGGGGREGGRERASARTARWPARPASVPASRTAPSTLCRRGGCWLAAGRGGGSGRGQERGQARSRHSPTQHGRPELGARAPCSTPHPARPRSHGPRTHLQASWEARCDGQGKGGCVARQKHDGASAANREKE